MTIVMGWEKCRYGGCEIRGALCSLEEFNFDTEKCAKHDNLKCYVCGSPANLNCPSGKHSLCGAGGCTTNHYRVCCTAPNPEE